MIHAFKEKLKAFVNFVKENKNNYTPSYRLLEIIKDEDDIYTVLIQVINKNQTFYSTPEEILADDTLVDKFLPRDIRTLTYLGYLGINSPRYKILARRLAQDDKTIFIIKKRGSKQVIIQTASEIISQNEIISNIKPEDAQLIGYASASDSIADEQHQKSLLNAN